MTSNNNSVKTAQMIAITHLWSKIFHLYMCIYGSIMEGKHIQKALVDSLLTNAVFATT